MRSLLKLDHNFLIRYRIGLRDSITAKKDFLDLKQFGKLVLSNNSNIPEYLEKRDKITGVNKSTEFEWVFRRPGLTISLSIKIGKNGNVIAYWLEYMELENLSIYEFSEGVLADMEKGLSNN